MDGAAAYWSPALVVAVISVVNFLWQRNQNSKEQAKLAGKFEQKVEGLCREIKDLKAAVEVHLMGVCPVSKRLDRLEGRFDEHLIDLRK